MEYAEHIRRNRERAQELADLIDELWITPAINVRKRNLSMNAHMPDRHEFEAILKTVALVHNLRKDAFADWSELEDGILTAWETETSR